MKNESPQITITDVDHDYRRMCWEISEVIHKENPFEFPVSRRRKFRNKKVTGETIKVAIEQLHKKLCT